MAHCGSDTHLPREKLLVVVRNNESVLTLGCHSEISKLSHSLYSPSTSALLLVSELDLFYVHYPELIMTSHLQYLGPLHSHPHSLLGLSCCLLCFSHLHCHFIAARNICSAWVAFCSAWVALRSTCVAFCSAWPFAQLVRSFGKLVEAFWSAWWHFAQLLWSFDETPEPWLLPPTLSA